MGGMIHITLGAAGPNAHKPGLGVDAHAFPFDHLPPVLTHADVVVSCTGAVRPVVSLADVHNTLAASRRDGTTLAVKAWLHAVSWGGATALMLSSIRATSGEATGAFGRTSDTTMRLATERI